MSIHKKAPSPWFINYFNKNQHFYDDILESCTSFEELLLQTDLAGIKWGVHDWSIILTRLLSIVCTTGLYKTSEIHNSINELFKNILIHIDSDECPETLSVFTNNIILKTIVILKPQLSNTAYFSQHKLDVFFAHIFKRWPQLAKMPYMFTTRKKIKYHVILRCYFKSSRDLTDKIINHISYDYKSLETTDVTFEQGLSQFIAQHLMIFPGQEK